MSGETVIGETAMPTERTGGDIEIRLRDLSQLFTDLDPSPFTDWITACGLEDAAFTTMSRELGSPLTVDDVRPAAIEAVGEVFGLDFDELPTDDGAGLWPQRIHASLASR